MKISACVIAAAALAAPALAQTPTLQNGDFEIQCAFGCGCTGAFAEGWHAPGCNNSVVRRFVGDGLTPALSPIGTPNALTPRSGNAVMALTTRGSGGYVGFHTDTVNFCYCDQTCGTICNGPYPFFDPFWDYNGGDTVVTGWYMIPANAPITGDHAGIKINVKVQNQDVATLEDLSITGHTNGQWTQFTMVFTREQVQEKYECNRGIRPDCGCNCVPAAPLPNHLKIEPLRFAGDGTATSGVIFWDDITFVQLPPVTGCDADANQDGNVDQGDVDYVINVVAGGDNPTNFDGDFNRDGNVDQGDIDALINVVAGGDCP